MDFKLSKNKKSTTINSIESSFPIHLHVTIETFMRFDWKQNKTKQKHNNTAYQTSPKP